MSKPKAGPAEQANLAAANQTQAERVKLEGQNEGELGQFTGPAGDTPFYRNEVQLGRASTARASDTATAGTRAAAHSAGYGCEQPIAEAADRSLDAQEASAPADVPRYALSDSANLGLQAAGIRSGEISSLNPSSMYSTGTDAEVR